MRYIKKKTIPFFFTTDTKSLSEWDEYQASDKRKLKQHILTEEQFQLCCYCESKISNDLSNSHIEHIKPKGLTKYRSKQFDYNNLLVSCDGKHFNAITTEDSDHCGHKKDNAFNEDFFLDPTQISDIKDYFKYNKDTGIITGTKLGGNKSSYTILLLNLNGQNNRVAQARLIAKNTIIKLLNDRTEEDNKIILEKLLNNNNLQFYSFLNYCFR